MVNLFVKLISNSINNVRRAPRLSICSYNYSSYGKNTCESGRKNSRTRDHMKRTEHSQRRKLFCSSKVVSLEELSPTVKGLKLFIEKRERINAEFQAGQWVDMVIPGVDTVGGFSICNAPQDLQQNGIIELAVKFSDHPPAHWIHTKCSVGDEVSVRVGGNFYFQDNDRKHIVLIAGGVGINPLYSILQHWRNLILKSPSNTADQQTAMVYSAKTIKELLFQEEILRICNEIKARCDFHVTKETTPILDLTNEAKTIRNEKVSRQSLSTSLNCINPNLANCYICGPPKFIERIEEYLMDMGVLKQHIFYEKWW
uniref:Oxidoreductase NAD-binding domain-containing protein 1 n=1 Tax=Ciona savignyi TaxID=51511 RepID=H2ZJN9_CIOSA